MRPALNKSRNDLEVSHEFLSKLPKLRRDKLKKYNKKNLKIYTLNNIFIGAESYEDKSSCNMRKFNSAKGLNKILDELGRVYCRVINNSNEFNLFIFSELNDLDGIFEYNCNFLLRYNKLNKINCAVNNLYSTLKDRLDRYIVIENKISISTLENIRKIKEKVLSSNIDQASYFYLMQEINAIRNRGCLDSLVKKCNKLNSAALDQFIADRNAITAPAKSSQLHSDIPYSGNCDGPTTGDRGSTSSKYR